MDPLDIPDKIESGAFDDLLVNIETACRNRRSQSAEEGKEVPWEDVPFEGTDLPLPNQRFSDGIVVASVWINDETPGEGYALLLLLLPEPGQFYGLAQIEQRNGAWFEYTNRQRFPNIVPAVEAYQQQGGDY